MALFDKLFKKPEPPSAPTDEAPNPEKPIPEQDKWASYQEWLEHSAEPKIVSIEANVPERSSSTPEEATAMYDALLSDKHKDSIYWCNEPLIGWGIKGLEHSIIAWILLRCRRCGIHIKVIGGQRSDYYDTPCSCGGELKAFFLKPSREILRRMRDIFRIHARYLELMDAGKQHHERAEWAACGEAFKQAATMQGGSVAVALAGLRWYQSFADQAEWDFAKIVDPLLDEGAPPASAEQLQVANAAINGITKIGHTFADRKTFIVAFYSYDKAVKMRERLLAKYPKDPTLLRSQACDLDECGVTLLKLDQNRRNEALDMIRKAYRIMVELDRSDPSGAEARANDKAAILANLPAGEHK